MSNKDNTIKHTRKFWQERSASDVSYEDARQMIENVTGFFDLLSEWEMAEREGTQSTAKLEDSSEVREASHKDY